MVSAAREDMAFMQNKTEGDAKDMVGCVGRVFTEAQQQGVQRPDNMSLHRSGTVRDYNSFRRSTTDMNVARLCLLEKMSPGMENLFARALCNRQYGDINKQVGTELSKITDDLREGWIVTYEEAERWNTLRLRQLRDRRIHNMKPTRCGFYHTPAGCREEDNCHHIHMERTTRRRPYAGEGLPSLV